LHIPAFGIKRTNVKIVSPAAMRFIAEITGMYLGVGQIVTANLEERHRFPSSNSAIVAREDRAGICTAVNGPIYYHSVYFLLLYERKNREACS
jgi:hypothetical protein